MKFKRYLFDKFQTTIKGSVNINTLLVCWMLASTLNHLQYLPGNIWIAGRRESPLPLTWDGCMCLSIVTCPRLIVDMPWPKLPSPCSLIKTWAQGLGGFTRLYTRWSLLFAPQIKATPYKYEGASGADGTKHPGTTETEQQRGLRPSPSIPSPWGCSSPWGVGWATANIQAPWIPRR